MATTTYRAGIVGVTGYAGMELARLLATHPSLTLGAATSRSEAGQTLGDLLPQLRGFPEAELVVTEPDPAHLAATCDVVFLAVPHKAAMAVVPELLAAGLVVVDLSADFRLQDASVYEQWYATTHTATELLGQAVYGLPELNGEATKGAKLIANPGCYPTAAALGLMPLLGAGAISAEGIVVDAKSGVTGAGRGAKVATLYCEVADSFKAYGLTSHRHTPEIEQSLSIAAGAAVSVSFNPHLVPMGRGILATCYAMLTDGWREKSRAEVRRVLEATYADAPFVRVLPEGVLPETRNVRGTMFCDLNVVTDPRTGRAIVVSAIDNLNRGAAGQAVANANLALGLELTTGLYAPALMP